MNEMIRGDLPNAKYSKLHFFQPFSKLSRNDDLKVNFSRKRYFSRNDGEKSRGCPIDDKQVFKGF